MKIVSSTTINAPIDKVFNVFTDIKNAREMISGINKIEILSEVQEGVGLKWRETRTMFGKEATEDMEITNIEDKTSYTVEAESNGTDYTTVFEFEENNGSTEVTMMFEAKALTLAGKMMSILLIFFKGATKKALDQDLEDMKNFIEQN